MNATIKVKWLVWAIVVLFVMNAVTLGTILYQNYEQKPAINSTVPGSTYPANAINGRFFRQSLGFTTEQMDVFREANQQFRPNTLDLTLRIDSVKAEMFSEMKKQQPDTLRLDALSKKVGELHAVLKQETYTFYLKIRSICSEQQQLELDKVFEPLFINENLQTPARGYQKGWSRVNN